MRSYFLIVCSMAVWSSWGLFIRGLDMPVASIAFYNALFGLAFQGAGLVYVSRGQRHEMTGGLGALALLAIASLANLLFFFYALKTATVAGALLTHYTAPVFVALLAPLILGDRATRTALFALALSGAGLVLIFTAGGGTGGTNSVPGLMAGTASGLAYAFVIIISRGVSARHHPLKVIFVQGVITVAGIGLWMIPSGIAPLSAAQVPVFAVLGLMHSTLAVAIYLYGIRRVSAQEAGVLGYLEPVLAILLAFLFLGERPGYLAVAGGLMILLSGSMVIFNGLPQYAGGLDDNRR